MAAHASGYNHFSAEELRLLETWHAEGRQPVEIAQLLHRDVSTVVRRLKRQATGDRVAPVGRPRSLSAAQVDRLVSVATELIEDADCEFQVTARMLKAALRLKCSEKALLRALHDRGVWFKSFREKPLLTDEDVAARKAFAETYAPKPQTFWAQSIHAYLDEKYFTPYLTPSARAYARKITARGAFRGKKQGLGRGYVKPKKTWKRSFGRKVCVGVAICAEKVLTCYVVKRSWCGAAAQELYADHLGPALARAFPRKRRYQLIEDNDPTGHKSGLGEAAKRKAHIHCVPFPKHSPDLMPLDYGFWKAVNRRLRKQELGFAPAYYETRKHVVARLRRTIFSMRPAFLSKLIGGMKRRCALLDAAEGFHFEEGS